ncbi:hypothetical protein FXE32_17570 [Vibrio cholerae]|uniref:hypothetical protein n=1 Tax=Vibrio cholerae TaxID=666 RepID=UPI0004E44FFA|nr:hypothetical protein [Vibrio cholerae]KFE10736.1 hypothetical protein DN36_209 [Vibrio cholerae]TXZ77489.1 hypothetical protein FXE32_17570 [Vibrio cholerae]GHZ87396.1 hypothetical protein VCSRO35_0211 [Vibrio cholerae]
MKATISDFFGSNLEQEVLDEVVILPVDIRNNSTGTITLPPNHTWEDFECIEISMGVNSSPVAYGASPLSSIVVRENPSSWFFFQSFSNAADTSRWRLEIRATSETTATWVGTVSSGGTTWPLGIIGYKRRISRVGIDELMSAMSLPNLIANADITDNPINQRNFNGDWSSLAVGAYGYDQWMKVSSTHMGYVIEAGKYRPNAKHTLTKDDVVIGEFVSPASGHWIVSVPFATSGKFDLYAGQFKRPWHPVQDGFRQCLRYYEAIKQILAGFATVMNSQVRLPYAAVVVRYLEPKRKLPTFSAVVGGGSTLGSYVFDSIYGFTVELTHNTTNSTARINSYTADASITLAEVGGQITTV